MQDINSNGISTKGTEEKYDPSVTAIQKPFSLFVNARKHFCTYCMQDVEWMTVDEAAEVFNTDVQDIRYLVERSELHIRNGLSEPFFICRNSLFDCFDRRKTRLLDSHFEMEISRSSFTT